MKKSNQIFSILLAFMVSMIVFVLLKPIEVTARERENNISFAPVITKTAVAQDGEKEMIEFIQKLQKQRKLNSGAEKGSYKKLPDFEITADRTNNFVSKETGLIAKNFILRVDTTWELENNGADMRNTGFGIEFHNTKDKYLYRTEVSFGQIVYIVRYNDYKPENSQWTFLDEEKYEKLDTPAGEVHMDLIVNQGQVYVYLDNKYAASAYDPLMKFNSLFNNGELSFTTWTDSNAGPETRVKMSNIELWEIAED